MRSLLTVLLIVVTAGASADPLASWTDGAGKKSIIDFVGSVTREGSADYVAAATAKHPRFKRAYTEQVYGIPPEQVIGSSAVTKFVAVGTNGKPALIKEPKIEFIDDGPGKPSGINRFIGRRPLLAFGNSDGDLQMLQWTAGGAGPHFVALIHHTDAEREYAYDRQSHVGKLDKALDEAQRQHWLIIDMKRDWQRVFSGDEDTR